MSEGDLIKALKIWKKKWNLKKKISLKIDYFGQFQEKNWKKNLFRSVRFQGKKPEKKIKIYNFFEHIYDFFEL